MTTTTSSMRYRILVYLPTGLTCTLHLFGHQTFQDVRDFCWTQNRQSFGCPKSDARFRLYTTEYYFEDECKITDLVCVYPSFEHLGQLDRYSIILESPTNIGDIQQRQSLKADGKRPFYWQGYLLKCSKATGRGFWKKSYFVFQNQTLFWYNNQDSFMVCKPSLPMLKDNNINNVSNTCMSVSII